MSFTEAAHNAVFIGGPTRDPLLELKAENARLIALLEANGIQWRAQLEHVVPPASTPEPSRLSAGEKVALVSPVVPGAHGRLPDPLGKQDFGQVGLLASLRQRMAHRCLREAANQVRGLWQQHTRTSSRNHATGS